MVQRFVEILPPQVKSINRCFHGKKLHHCNITLCMLYIIQTGVSMVTNCTVILYYACHTLIKSVFPW